MDLFGPGIDVKLKERKKDTSEENLQFSNSQIELGSCQVVSQNDSQIPLFIS